MFIRVGGGDENGEREDFLFSLVTQEVLGGVFWFLIVTVINL